MFEIPKLLGTTQSIILETKRGTSILNEQAPAPSAQSINTFNILLGKHFAWKVRKPPCGVYNCFGLVWASRRTSIYEQVELDKIVDDDGYIRYDNYASAQIGDLVVFLDIDNKDGFLHVGLIVEIRQLDVGHSTTSSGVPWVLSKWDDSSGEVLHPIEDVPYNDYHLKYRIVLLTERPLNASP